jgi:tetratricopeptide (TPR) repeat protein
MKINILFLLTFFVSNCIGQTTDSSNFYVEKGNQEFAAKRFLLASKSYDIAIKFNDKFTNAYLQNGFANIEMRKTDVAKVNFEKVIALEPTNKPATEQLMELYFSYRQFAKAIEFANKCGDCKNAERISALCFYEQEDYGKAIKLLQQVLAKNNTDAIATYTLARSYLDLEEYKNAVPNYLKAVQLDSTKNTWMYELGLLYYNLNDFKNAALFFNKAVDKGYPVSNDLTENLGYAYIYSGEFDKGEKVLLTILQKKPGSKDILRDIALAYYERKMYDKSLEFCQKLLELDAKDGKALYQAGLCFQKKGNKDKGQQMCDKAIELDPSLSSMRQKSMQAGL